MGSEAWIIKKINNYSYKLFAHNKHFKCQVGLKGIINNFKKKEGDLCTPKGKWFIKSIYYRKDKIAEVFLKKNSNFILKKITQNCGWCDDASSSLYNQYIKINNKTKISHEKLWRNDDAYDIFITLDYNIKPTIRGKGSAIFIHCSFDNLRKTSGCIALSKQNLIFLINKIKKNTHILI